MPLNELYQPVGISHVCHMSMKCSYTCLYKYSRKDVSIPYLAFDEALQFPILVEETEVTGFGDTIGAISHRAFATANCCKTLIA